ncbi:MAG: hypothetical protein WB679_24250 [Terracidiphilus sp.]
MPHPFRFLLLKGWETNEPNPPFVILSGAESKDLRLICLVVLKNPEALTLRP